MKYLGAIINDYDLVNKKYVDDATEVIQTLTSGTAIGSVGGTVLYAPSGGTGDYDQLSNRPQINSTTLTGNKSSSDLGLADATHSHTTSDITDFPSLATVATSGDYDDLIDKPGDYTYATDSANGVHGFVPAPLKPSQPSDRLQVLTAKYGWQSATLDATIGSDGPNTGKVLVKLHMRDNGSSADSTSVAAKLPDATTTSSGTMSASDKTKLDGAIDTAGTGLSKSSTTLNHSNSVTAQTTQAVYPIKIDAQGHISEYGSAVTIPTVNNATLTIQKNSTNVATFTANASSDVTANISVPTTASDLGAIDTAGTGLSKSSTTLNHSNSVTEQKTQAVYPIKIDAQGHISAYGTGLTTYTRSSAGGLDWTNTTEGDAKLITKSALAFWNGSYNGTTSNLSRCTTGAIVGTNGATMAGQLQTSFQPYASPSNPVSVAMGSYGSSQTTVDGLAGEIRYSSGAAGSASINTAYTKSGVTIPTGWYNFFYMPHRTGGKNGAADGDNHQYGNLFLFGMNNTNGQFIVRVSSGSVAEVVKLVHSNSTMTGLYKIVELQISNSAQIAAHGYQGGTTYTVPAANRPSGMVLVGIVGYSASNYRLVPSSHYVDGDHSIFANMANMSAQSVAAGATITFRLLYMRATSA